MMDYSPSHTRHIFSGFVDAAFSVGLVTTIIITRKPELIYRGMENINSTLVVLIVFIIYRLVSLFFFEKTLGMKLFKVILLNGEEQPLKGKEKLLAAIFVLYRGTSYYQIR
jgi:hypothetical protein